MAKRYSRVAAGRQRDREKHRESRPGRRCRAATACGGGAALGVRAVGCVVALLAAALLGCGDTGFGNRGGGPESDLKSAQGTEARVALVIGNAAYDRSESISGLENPVRDARLLKEALEGAGFEVTSKRNLGRRDFLDTLTAFGKDAARSAAAVFYYAGHAVTEDGENYLVPVDLEDLESVGDHAVSVTRVLKELRGTQNLVFLDSCRTPPGRGLRGEGDDDDDPLRGGLAAVGTDSEEQLLIGFAAAPGKPALDGEAGGNSPYAAALAEHMRTPGLAVTEMLMKVRNEVRSSTDKKQVPWQNVSLAENFYFVPSPSEVEPPPRVEPDNETTDGGSTVVGKPQLPAWERQWKDVVAGTRNPGTVRKYIEMWKGEPRAAVQVAEAEGLLAKLVKPPPPPVVSGTSSSASGSGTGAPGGGSRVPRPGDVWESPLGMEFAWVPAGRFVMGSPVSEAGRDSDEGPQREVRISRGYWMGRYEVTQGEWEAVMGSNPAYFKGCGSRCPVENVSWEDVQGFIGRLNARESGRGNRYRLPTEAEWEYAARAGTTGARHGELDAIAWWDRNSRRAHAVRRKLGNGWGLHDMLGNMWEWTADWYGKYPSGSVTDPTGPSAGSYRVGRGGGWVSDARYVRSASRYYGSPGGRNNAVGFRLVRTD